MWRENGGKRVTHYNEKGEIKTPINYYPELRRAEPYVAEDGIYMPLHDYIYEGVATEYQLVLTKEIFQEAFKEYIVKEGLNVQSKEQKNKRNSSST